MCSNGKRPLTVWYIFLENVNYQADTIFNIAFNDSHKDFINKKSKYIWVEEGLHLEKRMVYNFKFLTDIETFLIKQGFYFSWVQNPKDGTDIGLRIEPTRVDFNDFLQDCLTFEQFSWHRYYMNIKDIDGRTTLYNN